MIVCGFESCSSPQVYIPNREWDFSIKRKDSINIKFDTINLKVFDEITYKFNFGQTKIVYTYKQSIDSLKMKTNVSEITGVIDRSGSLLTNWLFCPKIWIHPPRSLEMRLTEMLPFPNIKYPIFIGQKINWSLTPKDGWKELENIEVCGYSEIVNKIYFQNSAISDSCWVINAVGNSKAGNYKSNYLFSEKYGFMYLFYDLNQYTLEMELIKVNFK